MLQVTLDIFSGTANPTWILSKREEATLAELLSAEPSQVAAIGATTRLGLGYRGLIVRRIKADDGVWDKKMASRRRPFPSDFRLGTKPSAKDSAAEWLIKRARRRELRLSDDAWQIVSRGVQLAPPTRGPRGPSARIDRARIRAAKVAADVPYSIRSKHHETWWACGSNFFAANAFAFNDPAHIALNNCYCFASNHLADVRFARPGQRAGHPAVSLTCGSVIDGLRADGWKDGCEPNALTIVLVIWPNNDYHFYRLVTGGPYWWWGHKPGGTPARYTDDCGNAIYQYQGKGYAPNNICRGPYSDFCGYFYQNNFTAYVA